jgi:hypothetical protein
MAAKGKNMIHQDSNVSSLDMPDDYKIMLGTYILESSEKFEQFMNKLGVSSFMLLSDGVTKPVTVISYVVQLAQFKLETRTALKKTELVFKINEEFVEITGDGRRATSKVTTENNVMTHVQMGETAMNMLNTEIVRTFDKDMMRCVCKITTRGSEVVCLRTYRRIEDDYLEEEDIHVPAK